MADAEAVERLVAAFNAHDAAAFSAAFSSDGKMYEFPDKTAGSSRTSTTLSRYLSASTGLS